MRIKNPRERPNREYFENHDDDNHANGLLIVSRVFMWVYNKNIISDSKFKTLQIIIIIIFKTRQ